MKNSSKKPVSDWLNSQHGIDTVAGATYEEQLASDGRWALSEGSRHFDEKSAVASTLRNIAHRLNELQIPYAVVGGMALFRHGFRRFTEDVDILVTPSDLKKVHRALEGKGYLAVHKASKHLRDADSKVRIEFLTTGDYPGDGAPKPVAFPDPRDVAEEHESIQYANLPALIEMKLASGMTGAVRLKDLADVMELIKILSLPADFAAGLNPYVRDKYKELCQQSRKRYVTRWSNQWLVPPAESLTDMMKSLQAQGIHVERDASGRDDRAILATNDPEVAKRYDMVEESEFWPGDD
jgi:hypothetical protein